MRILFINNTEERCGVYQLGHRTYLALEELGEHDYDYVEIKSVEEFRDAVSKSNPDILLFNFHPIIMPWVSKSLLDEFRYLKPTAYVHEFLQHAPKEYFSFYFYSDTSAEERYKDMSHVTIVGRLLEEYAGEYPINKIPTIGSFGFGLPNKRFDYLIKMVNDQYDKAIINLHIPPATYGDTKDFAILNSVIQSCYAANTNPDIKLNITTDFWTVKRSLEFLAGNDINVFVYSDAPYRGISSSLDLALSVKRPIAVSNTYMFNHVTSRVPTANVDKYSLKEIIDIGTEPLEPLYNLWTRENYVRQFEDRLKYIKETI